MCKLVTLISPCYNGEGYLQEFLNSVLAQNYPNIELIFINDGSTDATEKIILENEKKFKEKGYKLIYLMQKNKGQAAAINYGIQYMSGDYVMWPDSDDILFPDNIFKKVEYLENHLDCGFVQSAGIKIQGQDISKHIGSFTHYQCTKDRFFYDLIHEKKFIYCPASYLVKREAFDKAISSHEIYESRVGQNWQLLLPLGYYFKCGYISEPLFYYVVHDDSHSHLKRSIDDKIKRLQDIYMVKIKTLESIKDMSVIERERALRFLEKQTSRRIFLVKLKSIF